MKSTDEEKTFPDVRVTHTTYYPDDIALDEVIKRLKEIQGQTDESLFVGVVFDGFESGIEFSFYRPMNEYEKENHLDHERRQEDWERREYERYKLKFG